MKHRFILTIFLIPFSLVVAKILYVPECYRTIQSALISTTDGDTVSILSDIFYQPEQLNIGNKIITICNRSLTGKYTRVRTISPSEIFNRDRPSPGWSGQQMVNEPDTFFDCTGDIAVDRNNTAWVVWWGTYDDGEPDQIYFTRSNGTGWGGEQLVHPLTPDTCNYRPYIAFDSEDRAFVVWTREAEPQGHCDWEIYYSRWNGEDWELPRQLNPTNPTRMDIAKEIACGGNEVWVVTTSYYGSRIYPDSCDIFATRWNGTGWDTLVKVSPDEGHWHWFSSITVDNMGRPHIVWCEPYLGRLYYRMRDVNGWTPPIWINDPSKIRCDNWAAPQIAIDEIGNIHVIWVGMTIGENDCDIFYSKFNGHQWLDPIRLNINDEKLELYPDIAVISPENIWAVWDKEFSFWDLHVYASHFNGVDWSEEEMVDDTLQSFCNHSATISLDQNGYPLVIFDGIPQTANQMMNVYSIRYLSSSVSETNNLFCLLQNRPNPFHHKTIFSYNLLTPTYVTLKVYNSNGSLVKSLVNDYQKPGSYTISWDGTDENGTKAGSGVYFCKLSTEEFIETRRIILVR